LSRGCGEEKEGGKGAASEEEMGERGLAISQYRRWRLNFAREMQKRRGDFGRERAFLILS
jgi:hypothetical protein